VVTNVCEAKVMSELEFIVWFLISAIVRCRAAINDAIKAARRAMNFSAG